jgi:AAA15 family ATPase/GTPase
VRRARLGQASPSAGRRWGVQVFATTHSLEAIDAVLDAIPEGDTESLAVYHLARSEGAITARRSASPDVHYLRRERALDVR